jgi:hypothetical protein
VEAMAFFSKGWRHISRKWYREIKKRRSPNDAAEIKKRRRQAFFSGRFKIFIEKPMGILRFLQANEI